jgi:hypothetical protein
MSPQGVRSALYRKQVLKTERPSESPPQKIPKIGPEKMIEIAALPAALASAQPGALFRVELANGNIATLIVSDISSSAEPPAKLDPWAEYHPAIGELRASGLSVQAAAIRLVDEGRVPLRNTLPASRANSLAKSYRATHCKLEASAFDFQPVSSTPEQNRAKLMPIQEKTGMELDNRPAAAPDALILTRRRAPQRYHIDLDAEGLGDATRDDILNESFWEDAKAHGSIQQGDVVELTSANGFHGDVLIGPETDVGFRVAVLDHAHAVAPFTPAEAA